MNMFSPYEISLAIYANSYVSLNLSLNRLREASDCITPFLVHAHYYSGIRTLLELCVLQYDNLPSLMERHRFGVTSWLSCNQKSFGSGLSLSLTAEMNVDYLTCRSYVSVNVIALFIHIVVNLMPNIRAGTLFIVWKDVTLMGRVDYRFEVSFYVHSYEKNKLINTSLSKIIVVTYLQYVFVILKHLLLN